MITTILFDFYETLARPDWAGLSSRRASLAERLGVDTGLMMQQFRLTHPDRMRGRFGSLESDLAAVIAGCGLARPSAAELRELAKIEYASWARGVSLYADVLPELRRFRQAGYRLGIVSNASREAASVVRFLLLQRVVDVVAISCETGLVKPGPRLLRWALDRLGIQPDQALLVDDALTNVLAARAIGMSGLVIARAQHTGLGGQPPIRSLGALWPVLRSAALGG